MKKLINTLLIFVIAGVVFADSVLAQEAPRRIRLAFSLTSGFNPGYTDVEFRESYPEGEANATFSYGAGIGIGGIGFISSSKLSFFAEALIRDFDTVEVVRDDGAAAVCTGRSIPIMLWTELNQFGDFEPFVRLGIGITHTKYTKRYNPRPWYDTDFDYWSFTYGYGGGVRYAVTRNLDIIATIEVAVVTQDADSRNAYDWVAELDGPFAISFKGFRLRYWF